MRIFVDVVLICVTVCFIPSILMAQMAGDANADGVVDIADAVHDLNYLYKNGPPPVLYECGDPNGDCVVNISDIVFLLNYLFKAGPVPQIVECGWSQPVNLGPPINTGGGDLSISFSCDFRRLALVSSRPPNFGNGDVFYSEWDSVTGSWQDPINCGPGVNNGLSEKDPAISGDGGTIYFAAYNRPGGLGGWDLWLTYWDSLGNQWSPPENLGSPINSWATDWRPFITCDGMQLYFQAGIHPYGMFVSHLVEGIWSNPVWLGPNLNLGADESGDPSLTADGKILYFLRWTDEGPDLLRRIWVSYWTGNEWGVPFMLSPIINYPGLHASCPWISPDGTKLYFSVKDRPGGMGHWDIWVSERVAIQGEKRFINR